MSLQRGMHIEHYEMLEPIAKGGMGVVWSAVELDEGKVVAIKAVAHDLMADEQFKHRVRDEARRHSSLEHPNIVPVLDIFEAHGNNCIVMEMVKGRSVDKLVYEEGGAGLPLDQAISIIRDVLAALDYAHQRGIIHRDVKPSNIVIDPAGKAHLLDFGISLAIGEERRTRTGQTVGTPYYMSPEQIVTPRAVDHRSDVYSLGCVFYELLTGRPPFVPEPDEQGGTDFRVQQMHVKEQPVPPRQRRREVPAYIDRLVMQALEKTPDDRIPGCQEFLRRLENPDSDVHPVPDLPRPSVPPPDERSRWPYVVGSVVVLVVVAWVAYLIGSRPG